MLITKPGLELTNAIRPRQTRPPGVNFTNILRAAFSKESFAQAFLYLDKKFVLFLTQTYRRKSCTYYVGEIDHSLPIGRIDHSSKFYRMASDLGLEEQSSKRFKTY
jgi:hypothetical protein